MPFEKLDVATFIKETLDADEELKEVWDNSRMEYAVLGDLIRIRKQKGLSQVELAEKTGNKQQVISRIENKENSPTLKTICNILKALDYEIKLVPRQGA
ncbi:MAG: helix-turn-helix domain-containing protein [Clostridiales bacterium]|jgi:ribosome-binding protein aMBF1 (putative translation factor)|nr:helix-turn-helix domain-containing protein [Clostridiales bacterium]